MRVGISLDKDRQSEQSENDEQAEEGDINVNQKDKHGSLNNSTNRQNDNQLGLKTAFTA